MSPSFMLSIAGLLLSAIGLVLPWYSYELIGQTMTFKAIGTSTGWVMIVLVLLSFVFAYMGKAKGSRGKFIGSIVFSVLSLMVVMVNNPSRAPIDGIETEMGYWLVTAGVLLAVVAGFVGAVKKG